MNNKRDFKGIWIPRDIWLSSDLTLQEKVFLVEIDSLDNEEGCFANNKYFSDFFGISKTRVSIIINSLIKKGYITSTIIYKEGTKQILKRVLNICYRGYEIKVKEPIKQKFKDNNTVNNKVNNTVNNILSSDKDSIPYKEIIEYLNISANKKYKHTTKDTQKYIRARWKEDFRLEEFKEVIVKKCTEWKGSSMEKYLRPATLFGTKFESYLNEEGGNSGKQQFGGDIKKNTKFNTIKIPKAKPREYIDTDTDELI